MSATEPTTTEETTTEQPTTVPVTTTTTNWRDSLPDDLRHNPTLERLDSVEALAKDHVNVQKLIGTEKIARPKEDWTPEQFGDFYTSLGRPAEAKDYDLEGVERPEDLPWDDGFQETMVDAMHEAGLNSAQVKKILGAYIESVGGQYTALVTNMNQDRDSGLQDLRNEWGRSYDAKVDLAVRALRAGAGESFEELAALKMEGGGQLGDNPAVIKAFATLGGQLSEHGLVGHKTTQAIMSPQEAGGQINKLLSDPDFMLAYTGADHLEHDAAVKRIADLTEMQVATGVE